ncbi:14497_t:CDS:2, partial [Rhizophagus irregularis]
KVSKSSMVIEGVDEEEVVDVVNRYRKGALQTRYLEKGSVTNGHVTTDEVLNVTKDIRKKEKVGEVPVSEEDLELYNKVNQACSSCLPGIKKEEISGEEIIGHKRCSKEELSRGMVRSDETDRESGSEKTAVTVVKKEKSAQGGKGKKEQLDETTESVAQATKVYVLISEGIYITDEYRPIFGILINQPRVAGAAYI